MTVDPFRPFNLSTPMGLRNDAIEKHLKEWQTQLEEAFGRLLIKLLEEPGKGLTRDVDKKLTVDGVLEDLRCLTLLTGDLLYFQTGVLKRLAIGGVGEILMVELDGSDLVPRWQSGTTGSILFFQGGELKQLAIGSAGQTLEVALVGPDLIPQWVSDVVVGNGTLDFSVDDNSHHLGAVA